MVLNTSFNENEPVVCKLVITDHARARALLCERYDKRIAFKAWLELLREL